MPRPTPLELILPLSSVSQTKSRVTLCSIPAKGSQAARLPLSQPHHPACVKCLRSLNLDDKITPAASKTFAFIQLVQLETFDVSREVNWSYKEYQIFHKHNELELSGRDEYRQVFKKRFAAILAGERGDLQLSLIPWDYELWFNRIFGEKHFLTLPFQSDLFGDTMKQLADAIVNVTLQIIDNVPS